jgi:hypothetical protein
MCALPAMGGASIKERYSGNVSRSDLNKKSINIMMKVQ